MTVQTTVPTTTTPASPPAAAPACFRPGCDHPVSFEFTWPGKPRAFACEGDAQNIVSLASKQTPALTAEQIGMKRVAAAPAASSSEPPKIVRQAVINVTERGQALLQALIMNVQQTADQMKTLGDDNPQAKAGRQFAELVGAIFKAVSDGPSPCTLDERDGVPLITTV